jgi:uncharacterized protein YdeI (YjbR/CyaY-like superfamily)
MGQGGAAAKPALDGYERVTVTSRAEWRGWLEAHHGQDEAIWLVTCRKGDGRPHLPWGEIVDEALCFGWIDSLPRKLDADRTMLLLSPRRAGSRWSAINKDKAERLIRDGLMAPAGAAKIAAAKADGTWSALDEVSALTVPEDLAAALARHGQASTHFAAFPPSARRGILEWIASARRPETRAKRIETTAELAAKNQRANTPAGRAGSARPR